MEKIVIALGGNALGYEPEEQRQAVKAVGALLAELKVQGKKLLIGHGNGPQVGMIKLAMEEGRKRNDRVPNMPLPECGAMSQGYIGYHIQNAILNALELKNETGSAVSVVTQVVVSKDDPAFLNPSKPVGGFYCREEAEQLRKQGIEMREDAGRGYRQVVPSPKPVRILEIQTIRSLFELGIIVIGGGGGGIPVIEKNGQYEGIPAVIDKDFTSAVMADSLDADLLCILTAVDQVAIHFGKPNQKNLRQLSIAEAENYIAAGEFAKGSMLPKVEAGIQFLKKKAGRKVLISSLARAKEALAGKTGTWMIS